MNRLSEPHWDYFKTLCDDTESLRRFIEICPENYDTHSIEILRLLFATCSEVDVIAKLLCQKIAPSTKAGNIDKYCEVILKHYPDFTSTVVESDALTLSIKPWDDWAVKKSPTWWRAYNNVKHERNVFYRQANIKNLLWALAGLCVILCHYQQLALREYRRCWPTEFLHIQDNSPNRILESLSGRISEHRLAGNTQSFSAL